MGVMLMGKLRGLPAHTDVVAGFRFGRVVRALRRRVRISVEDTCLAMVISGTMKSEAQRGGVMERET